MNMDDFISSIPGLIELAAKETVSDIRDLAGKSIEEYAERAKLDAAPLLSSRKEKLKEWTIKLVENELTEKQYKHLIKSEIALAKLHLLTEAGIAQTQLERFRSGALEVIAKAALSVIV